LLRMASRRGTWALGLVLVMQLDHCNCFSVVPRSFGLPLQSSSSQKAVSGLRRSTPPNRIKMEGTKVVYFGKEAVLKGAELYKYEFYQQKFDWHVQRGEAKEAIEVIIASQSMIQVSPLRAIQLLANIFGTFLLGSSDPLDPKTVRSSLLIGVGRLLRDHTLWHLTPPGPAREMVEKNIADAETMLRDRWQSIELRHDLVELQPFFAQQLNLSIPSKDPLPTDWEARVDMLWERVRDGETLTGQQLQTVLEKEFGMIYHGSEELEDLILREAGEHPAGRAGFQQLCKEIVCA